MDRIARMRSQSQRLGIAVVTLLLTGVSHVAHAETSNPLRAAFARQRLQRIQEERVAGNTGEAKVLLSHLMAGSTAKGDAKFAASLQAENARLGGEVTAATADSPVVAQAAGDESAPSFRTLAHRETPRETSSSPGFAHVTLGNTDPDPGEVRRLMASAWSQVLAEKAARKTAPKPTPVRADDGREWVRSWKASMRAGVAALGNPTTASSALEDFRRAARLAHRHKHRAGTVRALRGIARAYLLMGQREKAIAASARADRIEQAAATLAQS